MRVIEVILALALISSLVLAGSRVYRRMTSGSNPSIETRSGAPRSQLTILFRQWVSADKVEIDLYPIDYAALEDTYSLGGRPAKSFEEFLTQRLRNVSSTHVSVDANGSATAELAVGNWWLRATSTSTTGETVEWRLPLTISMGPATVELSADNAYERTKKF